MQYEWTTAGLSVVLFAPDTPSDTLVLIPEDHLSPVDVWQLTKQNTAAAFFSGFDWDADLSPWPAEKVFRGGEDFAGKGPDFLQKVLNEVLPSIESRLAVPVHHRMLCGVSLAGLFALWAMTQTDCFDGAASVSGSLWFPGAEAMFLEKLPGKGVFYLSLGDREEKTRNPVLSTIGDKSRNLAAALGIPLVMHPGNHFQGGEMRLASAIDQITASIYERGEPDCPTAFTAGKMPIQRR